MLRVGIAVTAIGLICTLVAIAPLVDPLVGDVRAVVVPIHVDRGGYRPGSRRPRALRTVAPRHSRNLRRMSTAPSAQPKTLAEDLRGRSDDHIAALLRSRPDLLHPVPSDMRALTTRAATSPSIARYLDTVDCLHHFALRIASEQTTTEPTSVDRVVDAIVSEIADESIRAAACEAIEQLRSAALLWGTDERLHVVTAVRDQVAAAPVPTWPAPECGRNKDRDGELTIARPMLAVDP